MLTSAVVPNVSVGSVLVFKVVAVFLQAPVVGHAYIGFDDAECIACSFLQAGDGVVHIGSFLGVDIQRGRAEYEEQANDHGDHDLDEVDAALMASQTAAHG